MAAVLGVISDTHGLVRAEALRALAGVSHIIHAGDVGGAAVLHALSAIAPLSAIGGNIDKANGSEESLPERRTVEVQGARIYVIHDVKELDFDPASLGFHAVISGHSHRASVRTQNGVLFLNPGSAGPRRFRLPVTVARVAVGGTALTAEIVNLHI